MKEQPRAWIYCRIDAPADATGSLKNQRKGIFDYADQMGFEVVGSFEDTGSSQDCNLDVLLEVMEAAVDGKYDVLLVESLERLGCDDTETLEFLRGLDQLGVRVCSPLEGGICLDYQTPAFSLQ